MKLLRIDSNGNLMIGTMAILITSFILMSIFIVTSISMMENNNIDSINNDNFKYIIEDYNKNIEQSFHDATEEVSEKVVTTKSPVRDSSKEIEKKLDIKLKEKNKEYNEKYHINIESQVIKVENTSNPSFIKVDVKVSASKGTEKYDSIVTQQTCVEGLKDPLPFIKCGKSLTFFVLGDRIYYGTSLTEYLDLHGFPDMAQGYLGASTPLTIKKCPFDPYVHHGDLLTLQKCVDSGYFHESADGSCYLCRLEGKGKCPHYGFEVFITTITNPDIEISISASDHVIFNDRYPGYAFDYFPGKRLFLDSSHRLKYGIRLV